MYRIRTAITAIIDTVSNIVAIAAAIIYVLLYVAVRWRLPRPPE